MAWEHFTDWLEEGQVITREQRNELLDAFRERVEACSLLVSSVSIDETDLDMVKESHQPADRVSMPGSSYQKVALGAAIIHISLHFHRVDEGLGNYNTTLLSQNNILRLAAFDLGLSESEYTALSPSLRNSTSATTGGGAGYSSPRQPSHHIWNILRRAIQRLNWLRCDNGNRVTFSKSGDWAFSWEAARDSCIAASEQQNFFAFGDDALMVSSITQWGEYRADVHRAEWPILTTDLVPYALFISFLSGGPGSTLPSDTTGPFAITIGAVSTVVHPPIGEYFTVMTDAVYEDTGAGLLDIRYLGYNDPQYLDAVTPPAPPLTGTLTKRAALRGSPRHVFMRPNWTHP